jgi:threonine dehydrogenase-like Zn-dependent dehydrogenase
MNNIPRNSKAALLVDYNKPYEIREFPIPEVQPGGILVKVEMAGVCGTDVHQWKGDIPQKLPYVPGHEAVGRILKIGGGTRKDCTGETLKEGDRIMWAHVFCGHCFSCAVNNQPTLCENKFSYGFSNPDAYSPLTGGFAEYEYVIPGADIIKVPEDLSNEETVGVCCAFRTAVASFERLGALGVQSNVVIQGAGPIGLYSTVLFAEGGAARLIVVGAPALRLDLAKKWGADHVISIEDIPDPAKRKEAILSLTNGRGPDIVVEASGVPSAVREGMDIVRKGGRYLIIGQSSFSAETPIIPGLIMLKHLQIIGSTSATITHFYKAIQFIKNKKNRYNFADMITTKYPLNQVNEAILAMMKGKEIKPVIVP